MECVYMDVGVHPDQKKGLCPLELRFLMVMSYLSWVLGAKPASAAKAEWACNCWAILPVPKVEFRETCMAFSNYGDLILIAHFWEGGEGEAAAREKKKIEPQIPGRKQTVGVDEGHKTDESL